MKKPNLHKQQGVVLLISLIVLVALTLAGVAMIRSVSTGSQIAGNLAFQQANLNETDAGMEAALRVLSTNIIANYEADFADYYYASRQKQVSGRSDCANAAAETDFGNGIPKALYCQQSPYITGSPINSTTVTFNGTAYVSSANGPTGVYLTYIIERLCAAPGKVDESSCATYTPLSPAAQTVDIFDNLTAEPKAYYRVTIRADGPNRSLSFVQTMLGA